MIIIAYANKKTINSENYKNSLEKMGYSSPTLREYSSKRPTLREYSSKRPTLREYKIVGDGQKWEGFMTKIKEYKKTVELLEPETIACLTDCYDVLACGPPEELYEKFNRISNNGEKIVFSSETHCTQGKCIYLDKYYDMKGIIPRKYHFRAKSPESFLNSGFIIGKAGLVLESLIYTLNLNISDDQLAMCMFAQEFPEKIELDLDSEMMGTICYNVWDYGIQNSPSGQRIYNKKTLKTPCFIHTPCQNGDFSIRLDGYGRFLLGDLYREANILDKISRFVNSFPKSYILFGGVVILSSSIISKKLAILYILLFCLLVLRIK